MKQREARSGRSGDDLFKSATPPRSSKPSLYFERQSQKEGYQFIAGVDEVGRGCLAGPVVAAAVILDPRKSIRGLNDSKVLTEDERFAVDKRIRERAIAVAIAECSPTEIDRLNILWASLEAMRKAISMLTTTPDYLLIDGNKAIPGIGIPFKTIIGGDGRSRSIAAASIVAKCFRDRLMRSFHDDNPVYGWDTNVGYGTTAHYAALDEHGPCEHHRRTFRLTSLRTEENPTDRDQSSLF